MITQNNDSSALRQRFAGLHDYAQRLREATQEFQRLRVLGSFSGGRDLDFRPDDPNHALNRTVDITSEAEFLVAVTGAFSSGKSTLLNLLLEQDGLLPASAIPMTAVCTVIRHGAEPSCRVRYVDRAECFARVRATLDCAFKRPFETLEHAAAAAADPAAFVDGAAAQESIVRFARLLARYDEIVALPTPFSARAPFIAGGGILPDGAGGHRYFSATPAEERAYEDAGGDPTLWVTREWLALVGDVELRVPSPMLEQGVVFLDLPGLNCKEDYHRRAIREFCNMADCIVVTAFQPGNQADTEVVASFQRLTRSYQQKTFFVFNKVDQFGTEPEELVRAVDYLSKDTIGNDLPRERFFLASAALGRAARQGDESAGAEAARLGEVFRSVASRLPGLDRWVEPFGQPTDPGGVGYLRSRIRRFLDTDAFPGKIREVVDNLQAALADLEAAAAPQFEKYRDTDPVDLQRQAVLEAHREQRDRLVGLVQHFRHGYLQAGATGGGLRKDLHRILDRLHADMQSAIAAHFERPILQAPLREDPVAEFDFQIIADNAADQIRQDLQARVIEAVDGHVRRVFRERVLAGGARRDVEGLLNGAPEQCERLDRLLARFEGTLRHSVQGIVRHGFFHMPRGRELRRLNRRVPAAQLKGLLVSVFCEFYPGWIYENIYTRLLDDLWLHLFLDGEDLERELDEFFVAAEGALGQRHATDRARLPRPPAGPEGMPVARNRWAELMSTIELCRRIAALDDELPALASGDPVAVPARAEGGAA